MSSLSDLIPADFLDRSTGSSRGGLRHVPLDQVRPNPEQPRTEFSAAGLETLAQSIREHGVLTPLLVRRDSNGGYVLIAGERRLRAAGLAGLDAVPVWVREDVSSRHQLELALVENLQREDLDAIEAAAAYHRLTEDFGLTQAEVAQRVSLDRATVANTLRLLRLPAFAQSAIREGLISAGHARVLLRIDDTEQLHRVMDEIIDKELSVRQAERLIDSKQRHSSRPEPSIHILAAAERMTRSLGCKVTIDHKPRAGSGKIVIDYYSAGELDELIARLGGPE